MGWTCQLLIVFVTNREQYQINRRIYWRFYLSVGGCYVVPLVTNGETEHF
jgi:hypothetical protein